MSLTDILNDQPQKKTEQFAVGPQVAKFLKPLASLKLTVALLFMATVIVWIGTLAQDSKDIWQVVDEYFRCYFAYVPFKVFCPRAFFNEEPPQPPGGFYFPGGWLIGFLMSINLLAAHGLRFKPQAKSARLWTGIGVIGLGCVTTWMVVVSGSNPDGMQTESWITWDSLWLLFKLLLTAIDVGLLVWIARLTREIGPNQRLYSFKFWGGLGLLLLQAGVTGWLWAEGKDAQLDASSMRILWQLLKGTFAGLLLLAGCLIVFKKRAGIVLLHGGIALMMFSELLVGLTAVESQISLQEGERSDFARDVRSVELAIVQSTDDESERHTVSPERKLLSSLEGSKVEDQQLPFGVKVTEYFKNARVLRIGPVMKAVATEGVGKGAIIEPLAPSTGTNSDSGVDYPAAYIKLTKPGSDEELGIYLISARLTEGVGLTDKIEVDGKTYSIGLRFKRIYKPYIVELKDVSKTDYLGTNTPRDYSSHIHITDGSKTPAQDFEYHVWMNNPLRYSGETFYQSGYDDGIRSGSGIEGTTLQVVTNSGWMIPYVSCMIVAVGMLFQFGLTLLRFLDRHARELVAQSKCSPTPRGSDDSRKSPNQPGHKSLGDETPESQNSNRYAKWVPWVTVAVLALYVGSKARSPKLGPDDFDFVAFGKIPIVADGRIKPIDTYARNTLRLLSGLESFKLKPEDKKYQSAVRWLLDTVARPQDAAEHRVFRIDNLELLKALGLANRKGFRYAAEEFDPKKLAEHADKAGLKDEAGERLSLIDRKVLEFQKKYGYYDTLSILREAPKLNRAARTEDFLAAYELHRFLEKRRMPLLVPPAEGVQRKDSQDDWLPLALATFLTPIESDAQHVEWSKEAVTRLEGAVEANQIPEDATKTVLGFISWAKQRYDARKVEKVAENPAIQAWDNIFKAYADGDARAFNTAVQEYRASFTGRSLREFNATKVSFEAFFNQTSPFYLSSLCYFFVCLASAGAWLGWTRVLNRTAFAMTVFTLSLHTAALIARIYISGRPPVTNLYTTAVFIGWGTVVLGVILEIVYRLGIGNVLAGTTGFMTLLIAHFLGNDGDTFTQLQAVLDTQFWLATHVTIINLGYATTLLSGFLGIVYVAMQRPGLFSLCSLLGVSHVCYRHPDKLAKWTDSFLGWEVSADLIGGASFVSLAIAASLVIWKKLKLLHWGLEDEMAKTLGRMIYGILCFAIFFSFIGTVLGGLWADDSWGRFWGWDPKENGALMIVLWNSLILHARWDGMAKDRGMALLVMFGSIITGWSWFGVNELGIGLHSYGFTEGVLLVLGLFAISQLGCIALGLIPKNLSSQTT